MCHCGKLIELIRESSLRKLPTNHDHDGGIMPIREYQCDQPSSSAFGRFNPLRERRERRTK